MSFSLYDDVQYTRRDGRNRDQATNSVAVFNLLFNCVRNAPGYRRYVRV